MRFALPATSVGEVRITVVVINVEYQNFMTKDQSMFKRTCIVGGMLLLSVGCASSMKDVGGAPSPNLSNGDNDWFKMIALSNMTEIESSRLALTQSQSTYVKNFAQKMIDDHMMAGNEVASLAAEKQVMLPTKLDDKHQTLIDNLKNKSGGDFDKAYEDLQVNAHDMTVDNDQAEANNGADPQVKALASKLLDTLKMHLSMAQKLENGGTGGM